MTRVEAMQAMEEEEEVHGGHAMDKQSEGEEEKRADAGRALCFWRMT